MSVAVQFPQGGTLPCICSLSSDAVAGPLKIEDLILLNITPNIYTIDLQTGTLTQLTNDGASAEPAWGP